MQLSIRLLLAAITLAAVDSAAGLWLLKQGLLTNSLQGFCNLGLLLHVLFLQIVGILFVVSLGPTRLVYARVLIVGSLVGLAAFAICHLFAEQVGLWLWENQSSLAPAWVQIEVIASLVALLGVPVLCIVTTVLVAAFAGVMQKEISKSRSGDPLQPESESQQRPSR